MPDSLLARLAVLQIMMDCVDKFIDVASWQETLLLAIRALSNQQAKKILEYILSKDAKGIEQYFYHNHYFVMKFIAREGKWLDSREFVEKQIDDFFAFSRNGLVNKSWDRFTKWAGTVTDSSIRLSLINKLISVVEDKKQEGRLRLDCAVTLGNLGLKKKALQLLLAIAEDATQDIMVRCDCAQAAGYVDVKDKSAVYRLLALAEDTTQEILFRAHCSQAVGHLHIKDKAIVNRLLTTAEDTTQENWVRACCAEAVGKLGLKKKALELLVAMAEDNTVECWIRSNCAHSLVELDIKDKIAAQRLLDAAKDAALNDFDRIRFIDALEYLEIKDKKMAHRLLTLAEDTSQDIEFRHSCARAAGKAGEKYKAVDLLVDLFLAHPDKSELKAMEIHNSLWDLTDI